MQRLERRKAGQSQFALLNLVNTLGKLSGYEQYGSYRTAAGAIPDKENIYIPTICTNDLRLAQTPTP